MKYEVEQKFPVADMAALEAELISLGAEVSPPNVEVDTYFAHPGRDFAKTDEALRLRRRGEMNFLTYKGPKIDPTTKTRREIELPLEDGESSADAWHSLLDTLGFVPVGEVCKSRRKAFISWDGQQIEASLDQIEQLGTFAELELVVEPDGIETAKAQIASLAQRLGLTQSERRSYLELLLETR